MAPAMNLDHLKSHYGSIAKAAQAIGVHRQAVYRWKDGIPFPRQCEFEVLTQGALKADRKEQ